jgi:aspartate carbamoyltransferase catalytic subunit
MNKLTTVEKLEKKQIEDFFSEALNIEKTWPNLKKVGENKTICLFFWEPSTRTKLSFEHAAKALGFNVLDFSPSLSSVQKGESLEDTLNTLISLKIDGLVMRHPKKQNIGTNSKIIAKRSFFYKCRRWQSCASNTGTP